MLLERALRHRAERIDEAMQLVLVALPHLRQGQPRRHVRVCREKALEPLPDAPAEPCVAPIRRAA